MPDARTDQPNLLIILTDQQRADTVGCAGGLPVQTPNLDRLAAAGVRWSHAVCNTPECIPARATILTGLESHRTGIADNTTPLSAGGWTFARALRLAGYRTWAVGKQHFQPHRADHGLDELILGEPLALDDDDYLDHLDAVGLGWIEEPWGRRSDHYYVPQVSTVPPAHHHTTWTANQAIRMIESRSARPFLGIVGFLKPHPPFDPTVPFSRQYRPATVPHPVDRDHRMAPFPVEVAQNNMKWRNETSAELALSLRAAYFATITQVDEQIGRILDAVDPIAERTVVVFLSDHGELLGDHGLWGKRSFLDGSIRIPLIIRRPGESEPGRVVDELVSQRDLPPTLLRLGGVPVPDSLPGADLFGPRLPSRGLVASYGTGDVGVVAHLTTTHRWSYSIAGGYERLVDLQEDPAETTNLVDVEPEHPEARAARSAVESELARTRDALRFLDADGRLRVGGTKELDRRFGRNTQRGRRG